MAKTLTQLVQDEKLRNTMGQRGRDYYENVFGQQRSVGAIVDIVEGKMPIRTDSPDDTSGRSAAARKAAVAKSIPSPKSPS